jgi:hypothetical protein
MAAEIGSLPLKVGEFTCMLRPPAHQPADIPQSNNQFFPSENLVKKERHCGELSKFSSYL